MHVYEKDFCLSVRIKCLPMEANFAKGRLFRSRAKVVYILERSRLPCQWQPLTSLRAPSVMS